MARKISPQPSCTSHRPDSSNTGLATRVNTSRPRVSLAHTRPRRCQEGLLALRDWLARKDSNLQSPDPEPEPGASVRDAKHEREDPELSATRPSPGRMSRRRQ
jgi:hypothetical protein